MTYQTKYDMRCGYDFIKRITVEGLNQDLQSLDESLVREYKRVFLGAGPSIESRDKMTSPRAALIENGWKLLVARSV